VTTATVTDAQGRYAIAVQDSTQLFHIFGGGAEGQARFGRAGFDDLCGILRLLPTGRNVEVTLPRAGCYTFPNVPVPMVTRGADFIEFSWSGLVQRARHGNSVGNSLGTSQEAQAVDADNAQRRRGMKRVVQRACSFLACAPLMP